MLGRLLKRGGDWDNINVRNARRVAVYKLDHIGDMLWATPALATLRRNLPEARITMVCTPYLAPVLAGNPDVDAIVAYEKAKFASTAARRDFIRQALGPTDLAICLDPRDDAVELAWLSGAAVRAGYYYPDRLFTMLRSRRRLTHHAVHPAMRGIREHEVSVNLRLLAELGIGEAPEQKTRLYLGAGEAAAASAILESHGLRHPPSMLHLPLKWLDGGWPREHLAAIAAGLAAADPAGRLLVTCGPGEEMLPESLAGMLPQGAVVLPSFDFGAWAAIVSRCAVMVCRDCGAVHVAAALGIPVVSVFEASKQAEHYRWAPWGVPHVNVFRPDRAKQADVPAHVRDVLTAARSLLAARRPE